MSEKTECYLCGSKKLPEHLSYRDIPINSHKHVCWNCFIKLIWLSSDNVGLINIDQHMYNELMKANPKYVEKKKDTVAEVTN